MQGMIATVCMQIAEQAHENMIKYLKTHKQVQALNPSLFRFKRPFKKKK